MLFGLTFIFENEAFDSFRMAETMRNIAALPFSQFWKILGGLYTETRADIFLPFILFIITRITENPNILFMVLAGIFGWFYLKGIDTVYDQNGLKNNLNAQVHLLFFILLIPIFNINGFRFWSAAWMFFYGAYNVVFNDNKKYLFFTILAALTHFSFLSAVSVLVIYLLIGNRNVFFYVFLIISLLVPELFSEQVDAVFSALGGQLQTKHSIYTNPEYMEKVDEGRAGLRWFMVVAQRGIYYYTLFMLLFLKNKYKKLLYTPGLNNLFSFSLFFISVFNFFKYIPSVARFNTLFYLFATSYIIQFYYKNSKKRMSFFTLAGIIPIALTIAINLRVGFEMTNFWLLGPIPVLIFAEPVSIFRFIIELF